MGVQIDAIRINGLKDNYYKAAVILRKLGYKNIGEPSDGFELLVRGSKGRGESSDDDTWTGQSHLLSSSVISLETLEMIHDDFFGLVRAGRQLSIPFSGNKFISQ